MRKSVAISAAAIVLLMVGFLLIKRTQEGVALKGRVEAIDALQMFETALTSPASRNLLDTVILPVALRDRSATEQLQYLQGVLANEVSPEGIRILTKEGRFGPLKKIFPTEADRWAAQASVATSNCVAFRLERNGTIAEAAFFYDAGGCKVIRCNNIKQLETPRPER